MQEYASDDDRTIKDGVDVGSLDDVDLSTLESVTERIRLRGWQFADTDALMEYLTSQADGVPLECQLLVSAVASQTLWEGNGGNDPENRPKDRKGAQRLFVAQRGDDDRGNTVANLVTNRWPTALLEELRRSPPGQPGKDLRLSIVESGLSFIRRAFVIDTDKKLGKLKSMQGMDWLDFADRVHAWAMSSSGMDRLAKAAGETLQHLKDMASSTSDGDAATRKTESAPASSADSAASAEAVDATPIVDSLTEAADRAKEERRRQMKSRLARGAMVQQATVTATTAATTNIDAVRSLPSTATAASTAATTGKKVPKGNNRRGRRARPPRTNGNGRAANVGPTRTDEPRRGADAPGDGGPHGPTPQDRSWDNAIPSTEDHRTNWDPRDHVNGGDIVALSSSSYPHEDRGVGNYTWGDGGAPGPTPPIRSWDNGIPSMGGHTANWREAEADLHRGRPPAMDGWASSSSVTDPMNGIPPPDRIPLSSQVDRAWSQEPESARGWPPHHRANEIGRYEAEAAPYGAFGNGERDAPYDRPAPPRPRTDHIVVSDHHGSSMANLGGSTGGRGYPRVVTNVGAAEPGMPARGYLPVLNNQSEDWARGVQPDPGRPFYPADHEDGRGKRPWGDDSTESTSVRYENGGFRDFKRNRHEEQHPPPRRAEEVARSDGGFNDGRGRGRGRGLEMTQPAWMTKLRNQAEGPVGGFPIHDALHSADGAGRWRGDASEHGYGGSHQHYAGSTSTNSDYSSAPKGGSGRGRHQTKPAWMTRQEGPTGLGGGGPPGATPPVSVVPAAPSDAGAGRGRGRGRTLPAWMTAQGQQA
jgi:hypothetical protein